MSRREYSKTQGGESSEFIRLLYLQSNSAMSPGSLGEVIDTGYKVLSNNVIVQCKIQFVGGVYGSIISSRDSNGGVQIQGLSNYWCFRIWNGKATLDTNRNSIVTGVDYEVEVICNGSQHTITYNGNTKSSTNASFIPLTCSYNLGLFNSIRGEIPSALSSSSNLRIYYLKLFDDGNLVRDFVPVLREVDNKPGMLDLVNNVFYTQINPNAPEFTYN